MNTKIYIQSAGFEQHQDYTWLTYEEGICKQEKPEYLKEIIYVVESGTFSVVLACHNKKLILLVAGLETKNRKDFHGRTLRNSVAWVGSSEEKEKFRKLAAEIILDSISEKKIWDYIDCSIIKDTGNVYGYDFDSERLIELLDKEKVEIRKIVPGKYEEIRKKMLKNNQIAKNNPSRLVELAYDLIYCDGNIFDNMLNRDSSIIIAVTDKKSEDKFIEKNVWRGLSNLVDNEEWEDINKQEGSGKKLPVPNNMSGKIDINKKNFNYKLIIIFLVVIFILYFIIKNLIH